MGKSAYPDHVRQALLSEATKVRSNIALIAAKHSVPVSTAKGWVSKAGIRMQDPRIHSESVRQLCIKDYLSGMSSAEVADKRKVSQGSVITWVDKANAEVRNQAYILKHSIVDGKKQCPHCRQWKLADTDHFYPKKDSRTSLSSYCIPCSIANATARQKSKRAYAKRVKEAKLTELHSRNVQARNLLAETSDLLRKLEQTTEHHIETLQKLLSEINSFFSRGRLLKIP